MKHYCTSLFLLVAILMASTPTWGAFQKLDDFSGYTRTDIDEQGSWLTTMDYAWVAADPINPSNNVLRIGPEPGGPKYLAKTFDDNIADNTTGTVFFRMRFSGPSASFGLSDLFANQTSGWDDVKTHLRLGLNTQDGNYELDANGGSSWPHLGWLAPDTWYTFWILADNANDRFKVYVQGGDYKTQTQLPDGSTDMQFSCNTASPLVAFRIMTEDDAALQYFDDIYTDNAGGNLINPIPEPVTVALLSVGGLMILGYRRRRISRLSGR